MGNGRGAWVLVALALCVFFAAFGCGGGGSAGSSETTNFFITDAPASDYDQVWVKVYEVSAVSGSGSRSVFKSEEGLVVDLASLNDGASRYAFLGAAELPAGTNSLEIELDTQVSLMPTGLDTAEGGSFDVAHSRGAGRTMLSVPFTGAQTGQDVVIDFDLSQWSVENGVIEPVVTVTTGANVAIADRHEEMTYLGSVSRLDGTPPFQSFALTTADGRLARVSTDESTVIFGPGGAMASLADGQRVMVHGKFSSNSHGILADSIQILGPGTDRDLMLGRAFDPNPGNGTFLCEVKRVHGFVPSHRFVTVSTPEGTVFLAPSGEPVDRERFYNAIEDGEKFVITAGQYDSSSNLFTARIVKLHHRHDERHQVRASGEILELAPDRSAFAMRVFEWHGHGNLDLERVRVVTGNETAFFSPDGTPLRAEVFYERVAPGTLVGVEGLYADHTIRARIVKVRHWGDNEPVRFVGSVVEWSSDHRLIVLALPDTDMGSSAHVRIRVTNETRLFIGDEPVQAPRFFENLAVGLRMAVHGTEGDGGVTASLCKLLLP